MRQFALTIIISKDRTTILLYHYQLLQIYPSLSFHRCRSSFPSCRQRDESYHFVPSQYYNFVPKLSLKEACFHLNSFQTKVPSIRNNFHPNAVQTKRTFRLEVFTCNYYEEIGFRLDLVQTKATRNRFNKLVRITILLSSSFILDEINFSSQTFVSKSSSVNWCEEACFRLELVEMKPIPVF